MRFAKGAGHPHLGPPLNLPLGGGGKGSESEGMPPPPRAPLDSRLRGNDESRRESTGYDGGWRGYEVGGVGVKIRGCVVCGCRVCCIEKSRFS